ncbi:MAG: ribose-5-phosphate isomerase RpiA [Verrucomicrobia bacterium]|nr:ribose-5-phosphate isomerase RpiA [Verrucomicrobiota bacterium]
MSIEVAKQRAGEKAASFIQDGMIVGLGTGSTATYFIKELMKRGLKITAVASSERSQNLAKQGGIPLIDINTINHIDITVDGADEIDPEKRMIKGGGGALLREKIVASMSKEMVVIVDESKLVSHLGSRKLPVEIIPFAHMATIHKLQKHGYKGELRRNEKAPYLTENGNYIYDIQLKNCRPEEDHEAILHVPGVVETGFFLDYAGRVVIGFLDGTVQVR